LSVVYLGTSDFAGAVLERLAASETHRPSLVVTRPDRPSGRGRRLSSPPVAEVAARLGLPLAQPQRVNAPEAVAEISAAAARRPQPPVLVVCAFGALIAEPLLSAQPILNVHPSLLPRWRGAAPVERAIMAGDEQTGVSIMRLTAGLDEGPVCLAGSEPIALDDTYGTLSARLQELGGTLLLRALEESPPFVEQSGEASYAEKIGPEDRRLDPSRPAVELERIVRALQPHIGARLTLAGGQPLGVSAAVVERDTAEDGEPPGPGELSARDGRLLLGCSPGVLELSEVQPPGGRSMPAADYLRGRGLPRLES
jgi:methionyl-tRNA formyltransferase